MSTSSEDLLITQNKAPMVKSPDHKATPSASDAKKEKRKEKREKKKEKKREKEKSGDKAVASPAAAAASPAAAPQSPAAAANPASPSSKPKSPATKPSTPSKEVMTSPGAKKSKEEKKAEKAKAKKLPKGAPESTNQTIEKQAPEVSEAPYGYTASGKEKKKPGRKPKSETTEGAPKSKAAEKKPAEKKAKPAPASPAAALKEATVNDAKKNEQDRKGQQPADTNADADAPYGYTASGVPKKKPGRPKRLSEGERKMSEADLPLAALAAKVTEETTPKKKRGRPKKDDAAKNAKEGTVPSPSTSKKRPAEDKPTEEKQSKKRKDAGRKNSDGETLADLVKAATEEVNKMPHANVADKGKAPAPVTPSPVQPAKSPKPSTSTPAKRKLSTSEADKNIAVDTTPSKRTRIAQSRMTDKICVVTGGVSGIGRACVDAFVAEKARMVLIVDTSARDDVNETKNALRKAGLTELDSMQGTAVAKDNRRYFHIATVDVCNDEKVGFLLRCLRARFGRIDVAVNNAGIEGDRAPTAECTKENFERVMNVNCTGTFICLKNEIRIMKEQARDSNNVTGSIVNISSTAGTTSMPEFPAYCASKHAIVGLSRTAAKEYAGRGVRVNCLCPGTTQTPMVDRFASNWPEWQEQTNQGYPIGRIANADEVAEAVIWLASGSCPFMTGSSILMDGGLTA